MATSRCGPPRRQTHATAHPQLSGAPGHCPIVIVIHIAVTTIKTVITIVMYTLITSMTCLKGPCVMPAFMSRSHHARVHPDPAILCWMRSLRLILAAIQIPSFLQQLCILLRSWLSRLTLPPISITAISSRIRIPYHSPCALGTTLNTRGVGGG